MKSAAVKIVASWRPDKAYGFVRVASGGAFPECRVDAVPVLIAFGDGKESLAGGVTRAAVLAEYRQVYREANGVLAEVEVLADGERARVHTEFATEGVSGLAHGSDDERCAALLAAAAVLITNQKRSAGKVTLDDAAGSHVVTLTADGRASIDT